MALVGCFWFSVGNAVGLVGCACVFERRTRVLVREKLCPTALLRSFLLEGGHAFHCMKRVRPLALKMELSAVHLESAYKSLLRNIDLPELAHFFLARLLLFQKLFLPRDVAAVAFGGDVFAQS